VRTPLVENLVKIPAWAAALLIATAVTVMATAGVAAMSLVVAPESKTPTTAALPQVPSGLSIQHGGVLGGSSAPAPPATASDEVAGIGSNYPGTAGWMGEATVALAGDLGRRNTGEVNGFVTVCADRCARLPVVDWCQCYWGTDDERVVDLSHTAWALVSDAPLAEGLVNVRVILEG